MFCVKRTMSGQNTIHFVEWFSKCRFSIDTEQNQRVINSPDTEFCRKLNGGWATQEWPRLFWPRHSLSTPGSSWSFSDPSSSSEICRGCSQPRRGSRRRSGHKLKGIHLLGVKVLLEVHQSLGNVASREEISKRQLYTILQHLGSIMMVCGEAIMTEFQEMWNSEVTLIIADIWALTWETPIIWTKLVAIWDDPNLNRVHSQDLRTSGNKHQSLLLITDWSTFETPSYNLMLKPEWRLWNLSARPLWLQGWEFFWLGEQEPLGVQPVCLPPPIMAFKNKQKLANHDATSGENGKKSKICLTLSARLGDTYRPFALFASVMAFKVLSCT